MLHSTFCLSLLLICSPPAPVDFDTEIIPLLTRSGCNSGACHGAAVGQGGFRLSLFGQRPADDHLQIVHDLEGRRINLSHPDKSLLYAKPVGMLNHGGGERIEYGSPDAAQLLRWLEEGAKRLPSPRLTGLRIEPPRFLAKLPGETVRLTVWATFADGSQRDVTALTLLTATDADSVAVDPQGNVQLKRRGPATVIARYLDRVLAVSLIVPYLDAPVDLSFQQRYNWIDDLALATLADLRLPVAGQADDASFLRRLRLDLTGTLPSPDEVRQFLKNPENDKRAKLVDRLLATDDFADYWTLHWANWLRISSRTMGNEGTLAFHRWVREQVAGNVALDEMARTMVTATGNSFEFGPANFSRATGGARDQAEHISELLMGARLGCANCHNHPFDRWTQDDYHGLAAIFARLERGQFVRVSNRGEVTHPRTVAAAIPRLPGDRFLPAEEDSRAEFAQWVTSPENPYFARSMVNRLWQAMLGRGLIEPVDDMRATNPATHPELLDKLAADFVAHGHDARHTIRLIANSAVYGRAPPKSPSLDDRYFGDFRPKSLGAEVLADAIARVSDVGDAYGQLPAGTRAIALHDAKIPAPALDILGRCSREGPCEPSRASGGLPAKLHLINGPLINAKIIATNGRLRMMLTDGASNDAMLTEFYLIALSRLPTSQEKTAWLRVLEVAMDAEERRSLWEDIVWSLLNCREFVTNH